MVTSQKMKMDNINRICIDHTKNRHTKTAIYPKYHR